ncbi:MAG: hypothetical protein BWK80_49515 [Desulfobacteraceae bacterium IS3]|nr:MAG: hypothetical protein BWK80_49515 [Desulfobacteraceae bacterium IS3]
MAAAILLFFVLKKSKRI